MAMDISELKSKKIAELNQIAKDLNISGYSDLRKQELIFKILEAQTEAGGPDIQPRRAGSPARRIRVPPLGRLQLSPVAGRHLRFPVADQEVQPAHRRYGERPGPSAEGRGAVLRPAARGGGERRESRMSSASGCCSTT